tara:strand:+ start:1112 stop:2047 length:936 start_codon:yes stop_codon:yes gene_type:complete
LKNLVTGGAGFLGSHLIGKLIDNNEEVICLDNLFTGRIENIKHWENNQKFKFINHDVINPIELKVERIWHLACPASPIHYQLNPIKTAKTSFLGTYNMLGLAKKTKARILLASTSEIYGDPEIHPQNEEYKGSVNPIGIRSCYDEGKRIAESLTFDYLRVHKTDVSIARIFNTYGPNMQPKDGRVISNFIIQALRKKPLTIYGDGSQTRSFCYVDDLINGLISLMNSSEKGPINIGNPKEYTILDIAKLIRNKIQPDLSFLKLPLPSDDPRKRKPDISKAKLLLNWEPAIEIDKGLDKTISYFRGLNLNDF